MDSQSIEAVFRDGAFRPLDPQRINLREGEQVRLLIEEAGDRTPIELAGKVYDGLSASEIAEVEHVAFDRSNFFCNKEAD